MRNPFFIAFLIISAFTLFFWYLVAHSFFDVSLAKQKTFVTDKCTLFPDGLWQGCCIEHDKAYWQGGTAKNRRTADQEFRHCVDNASNKGLSFVMYGAVRIGASPYIVVPWRWGYGWEFGRGYR